jgi:hypothetical protein
MRRKALAVAALTVFIECGPLMASGRPIDAVLGRLKERGLVPVYRLAHSGSMRCPAPSHEDRKMSASYGIGDDGETVLLYCARGCRFEDMVAGLGLRRSDFFSAERTRSNRRVFPPVLDERSRRYHEGLLAGRPLESLRGTSELGLLRKQLGYRPEAVEAFRVGILRDRLTFLERDHRGLPVGLAKHLPQFRRTSGEPKTVVEGARGLLYRFDRPLRDPVFVAEGPAVAPSILSLGFEVVTIPFAAGFKPEYRKLFAPGATVYLLPDADASSREHAERNAHVLARRVANVAVVDVSPTREDGTDVADLVRESNAWKARIAVNQAVKRAVFVRPRGRGRPPRQRMAAEGFLREQLGDGAWHASAEVLTRAEGRGFTRKVLKAARKVLDVETRQVCIEARNLWQVRLVNEGDDGRA